jgi:hypothetical protein
LIAAVNARPGATGAILPAGLTSEKVLDDYAGIKAARLSAGEIALAGAGLDQLELQLKAFDGEMATLTTAETTVETVATPYV